MKNIDFVAKHYRKGAFSSEKGLHRIGFGPARRWKPYRIAAAVVTFVALTATASFFIYNEYSSEEVITEKVQTAETTESGVDLKTERVIDFDNAPLTVVVDEIKRVYGVEVTGLPENASEYRLTLRYEGNVVDLLNTINEILDLSLRPKK